MKTSFWSQDKSMMLSRVMVILFAIALVMMDIFATDVAEYLCARLIGHGVGLKEGYILLGTIYFCSIPAYVMLYSLFQLLHNIANGRVFVTQNVAYLRRSSWCCAVVALACIIGVGDYPSFVVVIVAAGFMSLIIRIIKNVFEQAILMKNELDFTV